MSERGWREWLAPDLSDMEDLAEEMFLTLPKAFRERCGNLVIQVEDFPGEDTINDMDLESPYDLLGLYHGVDLTQKSVQDSGGTPDMVFLFRRPILDLWAEGEETLGGLVTHVLIHEIGHHFGLSDAEMEAIEDAAADAA
ncbi:MAG: metallopeptidase family protein [Alphaproteobacteria bacterium]